MSEVKMGQLAPVVCLFLLSSFVGVGYSVDPVIIEFLYYPPCPTCDAYYAYLHNKRVLTGIQSDYGSKVSVEEIYFYSSEGLEKVEQYNLSIVDWNSIVVNYEVVLLGGDQFVDETYLRELIDYYLGEPPTPPPPTHDVAVLSVVPASSSLSVGEALDISVAVKNKGDHGESFNVTAYYDSNIIEDLLVEGLEPNTERVLVFHWDTYEVDEGNYTLSVRADTVQNETSVDDNLRYDGIIEVRSQSTAPSIMHDIAILSVIPSQEVVNVGEKLNVTVTVKNVGTETESFNVNAYLNESLIRTLRVTSLSPSHEILIIFVCDTTNQTPGNYIIRAQAEPVANETYLMDNFYVYGEIKVRPSPYSPTDSSPTPSLGLIAILTLAFSFGFFETFSPCLIILLSFVLSYSLVETPHFKESFSKVMSLGIGFVFAALLLGIAFGLVFLSMPTLQVSLTLAVCVFALIFGLNTLGLLKIPFQTKPSIRKLAKKYIITSFGLFLLGFIFYFLDPCIAPILVSMVPLLLSDAFPLILFVFTIGAIIPFICIGIFAGSVSKLVRITYRQRFKIRAISGLILISYALYLIVFYLLPKLVK